MLILLVLLVGCEPGECDLDFCLNNTGGITRYWCGEEHKVFVGADADGMEVGVQPVDDIGLYASGDLAWPDRDAMSCTYANTKLGVLELYCGGLLVFDGALLEPCEYSTPGPEFLP